MVGISSRLVSELRASVSTTAKEERDRIYEEERQSKLIADFPGLGAITNDNNITVQHGDTMNLDVPQNTMRT